MTKQVRQSITPTHVLGSTGTAEGDDLGYRALADLKADLALNNVDNTSDATKNSAVATLTNKTLVAPLGINADDVDYDGSTAGLAAANLQSAVDELADAVNAIAIALFTWDSNTSSPAASISRTLPRSVTENLYDMIRGCVLNADGTVNYYLKADDWSLKADGTASDLTGADGNVMIEIPKFYYRVTRSGTETTWSISHLPIDGFTVHPAFVKDGVEVDYRYYSAYDACLKFQRSITAVADAGSGDITVTTSAQHPLYAGDTVTISGTTSYDDTYTVVSRPSGTTFTVTATFVATETGTATGFVSGKNLDDMTANIDTTNDELASVKGIYPLVGVTRPECRDLGDNPGTGWRQLDFTLWSAVQLLYLVEYQTFFSQDVLGDGNTNGSYLGSSSDQTQSPHTIAGAGDSWANGSTDDSQPSVGARPGTAYMKYRGIENFYGNCWNWADGILVNDVATGNVYIGNDVSDWSDSDGTGMTLVTGSLPTSSGYIRNLLPADPYFLSSSNSGGGSTTYTTDYHYASASSDRVVLVGGDADNGANAGAFCVSSNSDSSLAYRSVGARLVF